MDPLRLERIRKMEESHFWFRGRDLLIEQLLQTRLAPPAQIIDLGCGTGRMAQLLSQKGYQTLGVDLHPTPDCLQADIEQLPLEDNSCDCALLLDVLEHVDDRAALQEAHRIVRSGGRIILTVPAHAWLWSQRDEAAGHRRRYSRKMVRQLLQDTSLEIEQIGYFQCLLFPFFILSRFFSRALPKTLEWEERTNRPLLTQISRFDARLAHQLPLPFGSTLFAIGKKHAAL